MAKKITTPQTPKSKTSGRRYAKRAGGWAITRSPRTAASDRVAVRAGRVTVAGARDDVEDFLDAQEIDRRLADPANRDRIPWDELKARRGL